MVPVKYSTFCKRVALSKQTKLTCTSLFGNPIVLDVWPTLKYSPVLTHFGHSPLILNAYTTNQRIWEPQASAVASRHSLSDLPTTVDTQPDTNQTTRTLLPGVLALHIRRGDFENHCDHMATWSAYYNGWNDFPELPDQFVPPPGAGWGENTPENRAIYKTHCFPNIEEIVKKVMDVKADYHLRTNRELKRVYIMTNGKNPWLQELTDELKGANPGGWDLIASSRDLKLSWEQKFVSQALDMYVGTRAEVFVGNGVRFSLCRIKSHFRHFRSSFRH